MSPQTQFCFSLLRASQGKKDKFRLPKFAFKPDNPLFSLEATQIAHRYFCVIRIFEGSFWACKIFSWRCLHAGAATQKIAGDERNFQPATDTVLRKAAYNVSGEMMMRLDPREDVETCLWAQKLQLMKAGLRWILQKDFKKGQEGAREPWAELLLPKPKFWMGLKDAQSSIWAFQNTGDGIFSCKTKSSKCVFWVMLLHSIGSFSLLWTAVQRTQAHPSCPGVSELCSQSLWL